MWSNILDWLNDNGGAIQAVATLVLVVVTIVYAGWTGSLARRAKAQAEAAERTAQSASLPVLRLVRLEGSRDADSLAAAVRIENIGNGPAVGVELFVVEWTDAGRVTVGGPERVGLIRSGEVLYEPNHVSTGSIIIPLSFGSSDEDERQGWRALLDGESWARKRRKWGVAIEYRDVFENKFTVTQRWEEPGSWHLEREDDD